MRLGQRSLRKETRDISRLLAQKSCIKNERHYVDRDGAIVF